MRKQSISFAQVIKFCEYHPQGEGFNPNTLQLMSLIPTISFQLQESSFFGTWCNTIAAFHTHTTVYKQWFPTW